MTDKELDELEARLVGIEVGMGVRDPAKYLAGLTIAEAIQIRDALSTLRKEKAELEAGLKRLASPEAFLLARVANSEERMRMFFAEAISKGLSVDEAVDYARTALKGKETP